VRLARLRVLAGVVGSFVFHPITSAAAVARLAADYGEKQWPEWNERTKEAFFSRPGEYSCWLA